MFRLLSRLIAVALLALAPVIGVGQVQAVTRDEWPTYPSLYFSSTLCQFDGGSGSGFINCAPGGQIVSQINSSYQCNQINVSETGYEAGPISLTMVTNDGLNSQTISIDGNGTWYVQIPGPFPLNAVVLEFSMPDGAGFLLPTINSTPCPVATSTPTSAPTNTPNPSDTPTSTVNPSYTVTPIPTYTPLPSGHTTFTPTATPTGPPTATPIPGTGYRNCGDAYITVYNCDFQPGSYPTHSHPAWTATGEGAGCPYENGIYYYGASVSGVYYGASSVVSSCSGNYTVELTQDTSAGATGSVHVDVDKIFAGSFGPDCLAIIVADNTISTNNTVTICPGTVGDYAVLNVNQGDSLALTVGRTDGTSDASAGQQPFNLDYFHLIPTSPTFTPTTAPDYTPTPGTPTATPYVNPFWTATPTVPGTPGTAIPTDTECPGGCAVAALTTVPGISTMVTVDTSPFSPLLHLSLSRSPCTPFGYVQIPYPVITGTPALGQPLNFGWTVPVTHTWDDTHLITNTAIQPCAMVGEVSPYVWDFTYWGSGVALAIVFTIWLIGWVGRLSGDHTIDG